MTNSEAIALLTWCRDNRVQTISFDGLECSFFRDVPEETSPEELQNILNQQTALSRKDMEEVLFHSAGD